MGECAYDLYSQATILLSDFSPDKRFMNQDITQILSAIEAGDPRAANDLLPLVYEELRRLAASRMNQEKSGQTLQPTALVHEAFMRLVGGNVSQQWDGRGHFFAAAAESMRRILIENARRKGRAKRGGEIKRRDLYDDVAVVDTDNVDELLFLDEALNKLALEDPQLAKLVELRYFTGLTIEETAKVLGVSPRTTKRNWAYARAWLQREMSD
ncbi:RNA polymerase sigma factor SigM [Planctomycetes bacterium CA13]|uniref:RNA polymerase sigma factor SigM n=2 Tax=Novipirellula herctigrandis TaxID=2527986 RepID=A0A5C5YUL3_9BACT|nr:RNA polymerase sigma factor SigM [Planctomycetes bacterium CA13]